LESLLEQAESIVYDLDEAFVSATVGTRQGKEFKRLRGMSAKRFGPRSAEIVSRLSFRESSHGNGENEEADGDSRRGRRRKISKRIPPAQWAKMSETERKAHIEKRAKK